MLNMAPDKAADETTSFQCYPPVCLIIYRTEPPEPAAPRPLSVLLSLLFFFFPLALPSISYPFSRALSLPSFFHVDFDSDFGRIRLLLLLFSCTFETL